MDEELRALLAPLVGADKVERLLELLFAYISARVNAEMQLAIDVAETVRP